MFPNGSSQSFGPARCHLLSWCNHRATAVSLSKINTARLAETNHPDKAARSVTENPRRIHLTWEWMVFSSNINHRRQCPVSGLEHRLSPANKQVCRKGDFVISLQLKQTSPLLSLQTEKKYKTNKTCRQNQFYEKQINSRCAAASQGIWTQLSMLLDECWKGITVQIFEHLEGNECGMRWKTPSILSASNWRDVFKYVARSCFFCVFSTIQKILCCPRDKIQKFD